MLRLSGGDSEGQGELMQLALNLHEGQRRKREGMSLAASNNSAWMDMMLGKLWTFAWSRGEITIEVFRAWALLNGLPKPSSPKCWGALSLAAQRADLIQWTGRYVPASSVKTHAHPIRVLKAVGIAYG